MCYVGFEKLGLSLLDLLSGSLSAAILGDWAWMPFLPPTCLILALSGGLGSKVAVRVRIARGQERESICLSLDSGPHTVQLKPHAKLQSSRSRGSPTLGSADPIQLSEPLTMKVRQRGQSCCLHWGPRGSRTVWPCP